MSPVPPNTIENAGQKRAVLLTMRGLQTYRLICTLVAPASTNAVECYVITKKVKEHLKSNPHKSYNEQSDPTTRRVH